MGEQIEYPVSLLDGRVDLKVKNRREFNTQIPIDGVLDLRAIAANNAQHLLLVLFVAANRYENPCRAQVAGGCNLRDGTGTAVESSIGDQFKKGITDFPPDQFIDPFNSVYAHTKTPATLCFWGDDGCRRITLQRLLTFFDFVGFDDVAFLKAGKMVNTNTAFLRLANLRYIILEVLE